MEMQPGYQSLKKDIKLVMLLNQTIYLEIYNLRPKLGRSCRCIYMLGHGYESVVEMFYL